MASVQVIRDLVSSYVSGAISASDIANSFPPVLLSSQKSQDLAARDLALKVRDQIAHYSHGFISEEQLFQNLSPIGEAVMQQFASVSADVVRQPAHASSPQHAAVIFEDLVTA
jgi:hypothetical protein